MGEELEYRVPVKLLTNRDPIIAGKLSLLEMVEWLAFALVMYGEFNWLPSFILLPFKLSLVGITLIVAFIFIHTQVNGLSPLEWGFVNTRFKMERRLHLAIGWLQPQKTQTEVSSAEIYDKAHLTAKTQQDKGEARSSKGRKSVLTNPDSLSLAKPSFQMMVVNLNTKPTIETELVEEI